MPSDTRPGLDPRRLVRLMREAVDRCDLDLQGLTVLTEAASGAYVVTPVLAAMAGADVVAVAAGNAYSSAEEIRELTARARATRRCRRPDRARRPQGPVGRGCRRHRHEQRAGPARSTPRP